MGFNSFPSTALKENNLEKSKKTIETKWEMAKILADLTEDQISNIVQNDINEPEGLEFEHYLGNLGFSFEKIKEIIKNLDDLVKDNEKDFEEIEKNKKKWQEEWNYCSSHLSPYEATKDLYRNINEGSFFNVYTILLNSEEIYNDLKNEKDVENVMKYITLKRNKVLLSFKRLLNSNIKETFTYRQTRFLDQNAPTAEEMRYDNEINTPDDIDELLEEELKNNKEGLGKNKKKNDFERNENRYKWIKKILGETYQDYKTRRIFCSKGDVRMLKTLLPKETIEQLDKLYDKKTI